MVRVAIIYLSYHCDPYLDNFIIGLKKIDYSRNNLTVVIVDNPHPEFGSSFKILEEKLLSLSGKEIPQIVILPQEKNFGFAGGNNIGIKWAIENKFDYVFLHNQDGFVESCALKNLVETMNGDKTIGVIQPIIALYPQIDKINTAGNCFHYLGFGYCGNYNVSREKLKFDQIRDIGYASGAAMMMRVDLLEKYGLLDEYFFSYHEDLEYSLRLKSLGYKAIAISNAIFYHQYSFGRNKNKFYLMERNRYGVMLMYFKWRTLIALLPIALVVEFGLLLFAIKSGWIKEKFKVYTYWSKPKNWKKWLNKRKNIQIQRIVNDKEMLKLAVSKIEFEGINNWILKYFGNPIMKIYWVIMKIIIWW